MNAFGRLLVFIQMFEHLQVLRGKSAIKWEGAKIITQMRIMAAPFFYMGISWCGKKERIFLFEKNTPDEKLFR